MVANMADDCAVFISGLYRVLSSTMLSGAITHLFILAKDLNIIQDQVSPEQKNEEYSSFPDIRS